MKKILYGSTALVAVSALAATPAMAQGIKLGLGGYMNNYFGVSDIDGDEAADGTDFNPTNLFSDGEVHFSGEFTADNGISFGANIQLESFQSDPDQIDENFGYMEGSFGRLQFGSENTAAYIMQYSAPTVGMPINSGWVTSFIPSPGTSGLFRSPGGSTFVDLGNDENNITYYTPRIFGFQLGASYVPTIDGGGDGSNNPANEDTDDRNGISLGANYVQSFNGFDVAIAGGFRTAERADDDTGSPGDPNDNIYQYSTGMNLSYAGFTVGASGAIQTGGGPAAGRAFDVGLSYTTGPWTVGVMYFNSNVDGDAGRDEGMKAIQGGVHYALAPGVRMRAGVFYAKLEGATTAGDITTWGERDGVVGALGLTFSF